MVNESGSERLETCLEDRKFEADAQFDQALSETWCHNCQDVSINYQLTIFSVREGSQFGRQYLSTGIILRRNVLQVRREIR